MAKCNNPNHMANLKNWKKGQSGNPAGKPPKLPQLDKLLDEVLGEEKNNLIAMKAVLMALLSKATKGDVRAAEILLDRAYGKAKQPIDLEAKMNIPVINWTKAE